jgi:hypothetical protein
MNATARGILSLVPLILVAGLVSVHAEEKAKSNAAPGNTATTNAPAAESKPLLLVRGSTTPLGENSVIAVTSAEARRELDGLRQGVIRDRLHEPLPPSVLEQGGLARAVLKNPKPKKILGLFNPVAPEDRESEFLRTHKVNTIRGTPPLPYSMQDPIWVEPVGINLFHWGW